MDAEAAYEEIVERGRSRVYSSIKQLLRSAANTVECRRISP